MTAVRFAVAAAVFLFLLLAALSNTDPVTLRFMRVAQLESPLAFVVFVAFAAGVATGLVAGAWRVARLRRQVERLRSRLRASPVRPGPHGASPSDLADAERRPPVDAV